MDKMLEKAGNSDESKNEGLAQFRASPFDF
jgi:hypothetical protein